MIRVSDWKWNREGMVEMDNLKSCPCCGGPATLFKLRAQVVCDYCGLRTKAYYDNLVNCGTPDNNTLLNAVNAWNKRVDKS